jgi:hypothetical protein
MWIDLRNSWITGNPELIASFVGLVPLNGLVAINFRIVGDSEVTGQTGPDIKVWLHIP